MNSQRPRHLWSGGSAARLVGGWMLLVIVLPALAQESGFPLVRAFSSADIGTEASSWTTLQDSEGVLHFGCDGLVDFDGERWSTTPLRDAYALRGLDLGRDGRLWFAATGDIGWFEREAGGKWRLHSLRSNLPPGSENLGEVWHVFAQGDGAVFVSTDKIVQWDGKSFRIWPMPDARRLPAMKCNGAIYVDHQPTGLYVVTADGPRCVIPAGALDEAVVFWMEARPKGWLLATTKGLYTCEDGKLAPFAPVASEYIRANALTSAARLPDGRLVLGTYRGGLVVTGAEGGMERVLTMEDGLPTRSIFSVFVDREGALWATSPSHIFRVAADSRSVRFDQRSGLPDLPCLKIVRDRSGLLVATDRGVFRLQPDGRRFAPFAPLSDRLMDLRVTERGVLAANFSEIKIVSADRTVPIYASEQNLFVVQPSQLWPGGYLISVGHKIVLLESGGQERVLLHDLPDMATSLAEDDAGAIWIGTLSRGIWVGRGNPAAPERVARPVGLNEGPSGDGWGLVRASPRGEIIALTQSGGWVKRRAAATFESVGDYPAGAKAVAADVVTDDGLWIVHRGGPGHPACVARISFANDRAVWQPHAVEGLAGIGAPRSILAETSASGGTTLWVGGTSGLLRCAVMAGPSASPPRAPLLRAFVRTSEREVFQPLTGRLPYTTGSVFFEFPSPEISRWPALRLETKVDGVDNDWLPSGPGAQRELTAMRDGTYTFRARAVAETGRISEAAAFHFEIAPPWWRTAPALVGGFLTLGAAVFGGFRLRVRALHQQNARLEEKVRERTEQLARASAAKTQFVANMSHDIRNPLNGIVGLALALENSRLDERQREIVATLRECTTYLSSLVDDVLDFASIEAGRVTLRPGPFVPAELLRSVVATLAAEAALRNAKLIVEVAPGLPPMLRGDAGRIQQILVNYVTNALKYAGGQIRLAAYRPAGSAEEIEFAVTDEGPGISEAEQELLFTKFSRLPRSRESAIQGAGLGLASCRLLADIMDGSVGVESRLGAGARFFLRLPLDVSVAPPGEVGVALPQANVLVVEDTDYNAWAAAAVLAKLGLAHERARTGAEALEMFAARRFNVVLLDRNLPDMDGTEVARRMREMEQDGPRAILLAVTAYCTAEDRARCLESGMNAFVGKPLTPEKLRKVLVSGGRQQLSAASVHVPPEAPPVVDLTLLGYLSDGSPDGLDVQIDRFLAALAEADEQVSRSAAALDFAALANAAHLLLSQAKLIGCTALADAAVALETAARARREAAFHELRTRAHREVATLTGALHHRPRVAHSA